MSLARAGVVGASVVLAAALCGARCGGRNVDWVVQIDPAGASEPLDRALLGHYDLSGALLAYDQVPGLVATAAQAGLGGADWRVGLGRWEAGTRLLPVLSDGTPCGPFPTEEMAAPPGTTDLDLIASRDWFTDDGSPVTLADTFDPGRYALAYARSAIDVALVFGARPYLSVDLMPRARAAARTPVRDECQWTFENRVSNVRPADEAVFVSALVGAVQRLVEGQGAEPGRPLTHVEIWNEPELPYFWDPSFENPPGGLDAFFSMAIASLLQLDAYRAGASHPGAQALRFGLASFADVGNAVQTVAAFDQTVLPGGGRIPVDFLSFHAYDHDPLAVVSDIEVVAAAVEGSTHYRDIELVLAEWGPDLQSANGDVGYAQSMEPALHVATVIALGATAGLDRAHHAILWDFYPDGLVALGIVDHDGQPKPAHRAYELLADVIPGDSLRVPSSSHPDGRLPHGGAVLSSRDPAGRLRALFVNPGSADREALLVLADAPSEAPTELRVFDDPSQLPHAVADPGLAFTVPARSLVLAVF